MDTREKTEHLNLNSTLEWKDCNTASFKWIPSWQLLIAFCMPLSLLCTNMASTLCQSNVRWQISTWPFFIVNFGAEHSKEVERSINEIYELLSLTIWIKSFRIIRACSCYMTSLQTDKTLGKRKGCFKRKQNFVG